MAKPSSSSPTFSLEQTHADGAGNRSSNETRLDPELVSLALDRHEFTCPHCQGQAVRLWPGRTILFATVTCTHCGLEFFVVQNEPRLEPPPATEKHASSVMPAGEVPGRPNFHRRIA
jgi:hypothetical protein